MRETAGNSAELLTLAYATVFIALFLGGGSDTAFLCCDTGNKGQWYSSVVMANIHCFYFMLNFQTSLYSSLKLRLIIVFVKEPRFKCAILSLK